MKTNALLLLASLAVLTSTANAASNQSAGDVLVLPAYSVTASRHQSAEQQIKSRLAEFRQQALVPLTVVPDLNLLNARMVPAIKLAHAVRLPTVASISKS